MGRQFVNLSGVPTFLVLQLIFGIYVPGSCNLGIIVFVFDVHVTVHRDKFRIIKPTRCTDFSNLFLE